MVEKTLNETVAESIRRGRESRNLTQGQLAHIIGTTRQSVNQYEKGHFLPQMPIMLKLARELEINLNILKEIYG